MSTSEILQWIVLVFLFFTSAGTLSLRIHRKILCILVGMLLKIARGQVLNNSDMNTLQQLEEKLKKQ